jgi:flagellar biosynthetic protein FliR
MEYFVYHFQVFLLIMMRMSSMMIIAPFFSSGVIPFRIKALFAFLVTLVIFPVVAHKGYALTGNMGLYALLVLKEVGIGIYIGFLVSVIVAAFQLSGEFFAVQIGFGINEVFDPLAQVSIPLVGQLKNLIGMLVFLSIGGHHFLIRAIYKSFELAPLLSLGKEATGPLMKHVAYVFSGMFVVALKISIPVVATIFLVSISMGVLSKAAPQMNIMMLGFPLKIMVAFGVMLAITPLVVRVMSVSLDRTFRYIYKVLVYWPA